MDPLEALRLLYNAVYVLDLSDEHTFNNAEPGELVSCTRSIGVWKELKEAQKEAQKTLFANNG